MKVLKPVATVATAPVRFLLEVLAELRQVTWPSRKHTLQSTAIVIVFSLVIGLYVSGIDYLAIQALNLLLK